MPVFAHAVSAHNERIVDQPDVEGLNETMQTLQDKGAKIIDVKMSTCTAGRTEIIRTYLVTYESEKQLL